MVAKLHFQIKPDGEVEIRVEGASGNSCEALTKPFEVMLGEIKSRTYQDSYYQNRDKTTLDQEEAE